MKIERWMKRPVLTVKLRDSASHAREIMERHRVNQLPVVVNDALVGIVTDRDLRDAFPSVIAAVEPRRRRRAVAPDANPETIAVEDLMARKVLTLTPGDSMADAARLMRRERIGSLPIVEHGRVAGIVTRSDVLDAFAMLSERGGQ
jgi:acetoin utilization protein AcuB